MPFLFYLIPLLVVIEGFSHLRLKDLGVRFLLLTFGLIFSLFILNDSQIETNSLLVSFTSIALMISIGLKFWERYNNPSKKKKKKKKPPLSMNRLLNFNPT